MGAAEAGDQAGAPRDVRAHVPGARAAEIIYLFIYLSQRPGLRYLPCSGCYPPSGPASQPRRGTNRRKVAHVPPPVFDGTPRSWLDSTRWNSR